MARAMRISRQGLELIKSFEGFRQHAVALGDERWMIGYGHTDKAREGLKISRGDAELILRKYDLPPIEKSVCDAVLAPLNQNEFDALVSFVFNIGIEAFRASTVLDHLNSGDRLIAAEAFAAWRKARINGKLILVDALVRRRAAERALFLEHPAGRAAIPSALVRPELDIAASIMTPRDPATIIQPRYDGGRASVGEEGKPSPRVPAAPELADVKIKDRLTRILGENAAKTARKRGEEETIDGASVEEIRNAISELADAEPDPVVPNQAHNDDEPAPLPFGDEGFERRRSPRITPPPYDETLRLVDPVLPPVPMPDDEFPSATPGVVDDLETYQPTPDEIQSATRDYDAFEAGERSRGWFRWLPYAGLSLLGLGGVIWGMWDFMQLAGGTAGGIDEIATTSERYFGPYLVLGGGILFVIAAYYLLRALRR